MNYERIEKRKKYTGSDRCNARRAVESGGATGEGRGLGLRQGAGGQEGTDGVQPGVQQLQLGLGRPHLLDYVLQGGVGQVRAQLQVKPGVQPGPLVLGLSGAARRSLLDSHLCNE